MDLIIYLGKRVHIVLLDSYYYVGKVVSADEDSLTLIDKTGRNVSLAKSNIASIKEVFV